MESDLRLTELRLWAETEAEFHGRNDNDFLMMILRSCNFDLDLSKKTFVMYYENRVKYPQWWTNRDLDHPDIQRGIQSKFAIALKERSDHPLIMVIRLARMGSDPNALNDMLKVYSMILDAVARRRTCQSRGCMTVVDFTKTPWWLMAKFLQFSFAKDMLHSFVLGVPVRSEALICVNAPFLAQAVVNFVRSLCSSDFKSKFQCFGDWIKLQVKIPAGFLPLELGGSDGLMEEHEDAFLLELNLLKNYLKDVNN